MCHNQDCLQEAPSDFLSPVSGVWSAFKIHKSLPLLILELVEKSQNVEIPNSSVFNAEVFLSSKPTICLNCWHFST